MGFRFDMGRISSVVPQQKGAAPHSPKCQTVGGNTFFKLNIANLCENEDSSHLGTVESSDRKVNPKPESQRPESWEARLQAPENI